MPFSVVDWQVMVEQVGNVDALSRRLPLPLARLAVRFLNARSALERHQNAYYLWEAMLKLIGAVAIVECAERAADDAKLRDSLRNLVRPSVGHWWEFVRLIVPLLADSGDPGFVAVRDILLSTRTRHDMPLVAGLDAALISKLEGRAGSRTTVRPRDVFDRMVRYRNKGSGHGAFDQLPREFHEHMGPALFAGLSELLERCDPLAGRRLIHVVHVTRDGSGDWLVDWDDLAGPVPQRGDPIRVPAEAAATLPRPQTLYLTKCSPLSPRAETPAPGQPSSHTASTFTSFVALQPLAVFDEEVQDVAFLNSRTGRDRTEYLSYVTGRAFERQDLVVEQRELISRLLGIPVTTEQVAVWAAQSQAAEEPQSLAAPIPTDQRIGEFELISRLGQGGMGVVYRARQASLDRQVALKCLLRPGDAKSSARFTREIHALGRVQHPNLVQVYQAGADGDRYFYAMELIEGATLGAVCESLSARTKSAAAVDVLTWTETLSTVCDEARKQETPLSSRESSQASGAASAPRSSTDSAPTGGLTPPRSPIDSVPHAEPKQPLKPSGRGYVEQVAELMRQTAEAVHALHQSRVIHRDIKPGNIMVTEDGSTAVLMDLGLAQLADELDGRLTRTREFVGTLRYASPEQLLNLPLDARTDIYSLGATLWELLTLKPLFGATAETPVPEVMNRIQTHEPESVRKHNSKIPADLAAIVDKCLEKDSRRRYATAKQVADDLHDWLNGKAVKARQRRPLYVARKWLRRRFRLVSAIVLFLVVQAFIVVMVRNTSDIGRTRPLPMSDSPKVNAPDDQQAMAQILKLNNVAIGLLKDGKFSEAREKAESTITVARDRGFMTHPIYATCLETRAQVHEAEGESDAAENLLIEAIRIYQAVLGPDDREMAASLNRLGASYFAHGKYLEAEPLLLRAAKINEKVLGPADTQTTVVLENLVRLYIAQGNTGGAAANLARMRSPSDEQMASKEALGRELAKTNEELRRIAGDIPAAQKLAILIGVADYTSKPFPKLDELRRDMAALKLSDADELLFFLSGHGAAEFDTPPERKWALLVGVGDYSSDKIPKLKGPKNDVGLLSQVLIKRFGLEPSHVRQLTDAEATRERIRSAIGEIGKQAKPGDEVCLLLSGTGLQLPESDSQEREREPDGLEEVFPPFDARMDRKDDGKLENVENVIHDYELLNWLKEIQQAGIHVLLILDVCHAGGFAPGDLETPIIDLDELNPSHEKQLVSPEESPVASQGHLTVFAACSAGKQVSDLGTGGSIYGQFTEALCRTLANSKTIPSYRSLRGTLIKQLGTSIAPPVLSGDGHNQRFFGSAAPMLDESAKPFRLVKDDSGWFIDVGDRPSPLLTNSVIWGARRAEQDPIRGYFEVSNIRDFEVIPRDRKGIRLDSVVRSWLPESTTFSALSGDLCQPELVGLLDFRLPIDVSENFGFEDGDLTYNRSAPDAADVVPFKDLLHKTLVPLRLVDEKKLRSDLRTHGTAECAWDKDRKAWVWYGFHSKSHRGIVVGDITDWDVVVDSTSSARLARQIRSLALRRNLEFVASRFANLNVSPLNDVVLLEGRIWRTKGTDVIIRQLEHGAELQLGDQIQFVVRNQSDTDIYATLLNHSSEFVGSAILPGGNEANRIKAGGMWESRRMTISKVGHRLPADMVFLIATKASGTPRNYNFLATTVNEPELVQSRGVTITDLRGDIDRRDDIDELFLRIAKCDSEGYGVKISDLKNVAVQALWWFQRPVEKKAPQLRQESGTR